jgi:hypothetical protein
MPDPKIFTSYPNHDRRTAELLYRDLRAAGAGERYSYRVKALGPWGETGWSNVATG